MKITCTKKNLKDAVSLCERISSKNLSLPVLSNVLISTNKKDKSIMLVATNLEIGLEINIPANIEEEGSITIPASIINNLISGLPDDNNVNLELQGSNLLVFTSNTSTLIKSQSSEDFPTLPKINKDNKIEIPVNDLITGLKSVYYSASSLGVKPEISSVYLYSDKENSLTFVSTDSFRLAERKFNYSFKDFGGIIIPLKSVSEIIKIFDGKDGVVELISDKNQISIIKDNIKFISRLTEGIFPDYKQIIPNKFVTDVVINKDIFINTLKTANVFSGKLNELNIIISEDTKSIMIKTSSTDIGEHKANIKANITGEILNMSFNCRYVFDCLQYINSPEIILRFSGEGKPLIITGVNDSSFQYLVMPMNSLH